MVQSQITALETENLGLRLSLKIGKDGVNQDKQVRKWCYFVVTVVVDGES